MGASQTKIFSALSSSRITSRDEFVNKTRDMATMADQLFIFMYANFKPEEIWDISQKPEEYVTALSELIQHQFDIIGYMTDRTVQGEIYFRKFSDLKPSEGGGDPRKREIWRQHVKNCNAIAFFFVRVFQILGAILFVLLNNDLTLPTEDIVRSLIEEEDKNRAGFLGKRIYYNTTSSRGIQRGGSTDNDLGPFEFLRRHLSENTDSQVTSAANAINPKLTVYSVDNTNLYVGITKDMGSTDPSKMPMNSFVMFIKLKIGDSDKSVIQQTAVTILQTVPTEMTRGSKDLQFVRFRFPRKNQGGVTRFSQTEQDENTITITKNIGQTDEIKRWKISSSKVVEMAKSSNTNSRTLNETQIRYILENIMLTYIKDREGQFGYRKFKRIDTTISDTEKTKSLSSKYEEIEPDKINNPVVRAAAKSFKDTPRVGKHCVNRALQLLDAKSIFGENTSEAYTKICSFKVATDAKSGEKNNLTEYVPTKALSQLYGKIDLREEKVKEAEAVFKAFIVTKTSSPTEGQQFLSVDQITNEVKDKVEASSLQRALDRLQLAFNMVKNPNVKSFADIKLERPEFCGTNKAEKTELKSDSLIRDLRDASQELLAYHISKTILMTEFLKRMFNIKQRPDGGWEVKGIKNSVLYAGFKGLDILTDQARELLVDYYEGCENIYQQKGVSKYKEFVEGEKAAATVAAPAATNNNNPKNPPVNPAVNPAKNAANRPGDPQAPKPLGPDGS
jgi:hypothetical protein